MKGSPYLLSFFPSVARCFAHRWCLDENHPEGQQPGRKIPNLADILVGPWARTWQHGTLSLWCCTHRLLEEYVTIHECITMQSGKKLCDALRRRLQRHANVRPRIEYHCLGSRLIKLTKMTHENLILGLFGDFATSTCVRYIETILFKYV